MNRGVGALLMLSLITLMLVAGQIGAVGARTQQVEKDTNSKNLDNITIDSEGYKKNRKGPVEFSHKKHALEYKVLCWDCHHEYKDDQNIWVPWGETKKCSQCHDPVKNEPNEIKLQKAFHFNCKGCHATLAKEGKKAGAFKKCNGCHVKQQ